MSGATYEIYTLEHRHDPGSEHMDYWEATINRGRRSGHGRGKTEPAAIRNATDNLFKVREVIGRPL